MRIAICVYDLYNGGAERVASLWANGFVEHNNEVTLILCSPKPFMSYKILPSIKVVNIWSNGKGGARFINKIINLRRYLKEFQPDVAIAVQNPFEIILPIASAGLDVVCVNTEHNSFQRPLNAPMSTGVRFRKFYYNKLFKGVTVLTEADKKVIGNKLKKVFVLPNPLTFEPIVEMPPKEKIVLAVGRLDAWFVKGFDILIDSWSQICHKFPDWELHIAGRGKDSNKKFLLSRIDSKGVGDSIKFLGFCDNVEELYKRASIFSFPSRYDGFGMALIEAMSQGCACVACDYQGRQSEIISTSEEGVLCPVENVAVFAKALEELMSNSQLREKIQKGGIKRSGNFASDNIMKKWESIIKELVQNKS